MLAVSLLIWARCLSDIGLGIDDYILVTAFVTAIALVTQTSYEKSELSTGKSWQDLLRTFW